MPPPARAEIAFLARALGIHEPRPFRYVFFFTSRDLISTFFGFLIQMPNRSSYERQRTSTEITYRTSTDHTFLRGAATDIGHGCSTRAASPTLSDRFAFSEDGHAPTGILRALSSVDHSNEPLPMPRRPFMHARGSSGSVTFEDSSAQSSPKIGGRRKMMTMSASDIGHGSSGVGGSTLALGGARYGYGQTRPAVVQRSKSSLSIAGRIIRTLSISSRNKPEEDETERPRVARKLTRRKPGAVSQGGSRASSTLSLVYGAGDGVPPVPPLPPGIIGGRYTQSEVGHGAMGSESALGHGGRDSVMGHARGESINGHSAWGGSTSHIGHDSVNDHTIVSPAPTRLSFATTQSAPAGLNGGRKLVKKRQSQTRRAEKLADLPPRTLASLDLTNQSTSREVSASDLACLDWGLIGVFFVGAEDYDRIRASPAIAGWTSVDCYCGHHRGRTPYA